MTGYTVWLDCAYQHISVHACMDGMQVCTRDEMVGPILLAPHAINHCTSQEVFLTQTCICIVMEYAKGGNLFNYLKQAGQLQEPVARCEGCCGLDCQSFI